MRSNYRRLFLYFSVRYPFFPFFIYSFFSACQPGSQPKAPAETYRFNAKTVSAERYRSTLNVPIEITTAEVERQLNARLTGLLYEDDSLQTDDFACRVWKRGPIRVSAGTDSLAFHVPLRIWAKFGYGIRPLGLDLSAYKETEFEANVRLSTTFGLATDWTARTQTTFQDVEYVSKPTLNFGPLRIPITPLVRKIFANNQQTIAHSIDEAVRRNVPIRPYVVQAWNAALQPYLISEKYQTYLRFTPTELLLSPLRTSGATIRATLGIRGVTQTVFGEKPTVKPVADVPDLKLVPEVPDAFRVGVIAQLSHAEARRLLRDTLVGRKFSFSGDRYTVEVTDLDVYGSQDQIILKTTLRGSLNGVVYFRGVPFYDAKEKTLELRDLDYDLDTRSVLARTASWLLQGRFTRQMQEAFRFPVGDQLRTARQQIEAGLRNRTVAKGITLNGTLRELEPEGVYLTAEGLLAVVFVQGRLSLLVDGL